MMNPNFYNKNAMKAHIKKMKAQLFAVLKGKDMKNVPKETTAFGKVNEKDKVDELELAKSSAAPDEVKKKAADEKKELPAEEQKLRTEQNAETVPHKENEK